MGGLALILGSVNTVLLSFSCHFPFQVILIQQQEPPLAALKGTPISLQLLEFYQGNVWWLLPVTSLHTDSQQACSQYREYDRDLGLFVTKDWAYSIAMKEFSCSEYTIQKKVPIIIKILLQGRKKSSISTRRYVIGFSQFEQYVMFYWR